VVHQARDASRAAADRNHQRERSGTATDVAQVPVVEAAKLVAESRMPPTQVSAAPASLTAMSGQGKLCSAATSRLGFGATMEIRSPGECGEIPVSHLENAITVSVIFPLPSVLTLKLAIRTVESELLYVSRPVLKVNEVTCAATLEELRFAASGEDVVNEPEIDIELV
jgi:hypothetical protein